MVKTCIALEEKVVACTSCGEEFKSPVSARSWRVSCPKCREVVVPDIWIERESGATTRPIPAQAGAATERSRIEMMEVRIAALETALADERHDLKTLKVRISAMEAILMTSGKVNANADSQTSARKLQWLVATPDRSDFSTEQGRVLAHNLRTMRRQHIAIRAPANDPVAKSRAAWFKTVFEFVGWTVCGPVEIPPETAGRALSLAVPELPVGKEAAETYLALKAAGFEPIPVLDPALAEADGVASLSLTLPAEPLA